ncbi:MAG: hypothetical protein ACLGH3_06330 [Actinomycetota bacterium]
MGYSIVADALLAGGLLAMGIGGLRTGDCRPAAWVTVGASTVLVVLVALRIIL